MKCPACSGEMVEKDFGGVLVDVCKDGCKGIWFDWFELQKLDENNEGLGTALDDALAEGRVSDAGRGQIACPKCSVPMHIHKYKFSKDVNVDECYACGGFFLDAGELAVIRETFMDEAAAQAYTEELMNKVPSFQEAQLDQKKDAARVEAVRKYTSFLRFWSKK